VSKGYAGAVLRGSKRRYLPECALRVAQAFLYCLVVFGATGARLKPDRENPTGVSHRSKRYRLGEREALHMLAYLDTLIGFRAVR
jgi:hypothetical protein